MFILVIIILFLFVLNSTDLHTEKEYKLTCYNTENQVILQHDSVGKPEIKNNQISLKTANGEIKHIFIDNIYSCSFHKNE